MSSNTLLLPVGSGEKPAAGRAVSEWGAATLSVRTA